MPNNFNFSDKHHQRVVLGLWLLLLLAVIFIIWHSISGWLFLRQSDNTLKNLGGNITQPTVNPSSPTFGPNSAPNKIVIFGDFQCPYCAEFDTELEKIRAIKNDQLQIIWKDAPNQVLHPQAPSAALAARCAQAQGKFWDYGHQLFVNQKSLGETLYLKIAKDLSLDQEKFYRCLKSGEFTALIEADFIEGRSLQIDGTPYFFINGEPISGVLTAEQILTGLKLDK